jgi:hypothetical protein
MSKQVKTLSKIAASIASWVNTNESHKISRAALIEQADTLTLIEKHKVDVELVNYYAAQVGVAVGERNKGKSIYGPMVAKWERDGVSVVEGQRTAASALNAARSILFAKEIGKIKATKAPSVKAATLPSILAYVEKRAANEEKISGEERKQIKHAILALSKLIG